MVTANIMSKSDLIVDGTDMKRRVTSRIPAVNVSAVVNQLLKKLHPASFTYLSLVIKTTQFKQNRIIIVNSQGRLTVRIADHNKISEFLSVNLSTVIQ